MGLSTEQATAAVWDGPQRGFRIASIGLPEPGPGEAVVRTGAATVCGSDLHTVRGDRPTPVPTVLGHEAVGTVLAAGPGTTTHDGRPLAPGTRVTWTIGTSCGDCPRCLRGIPQKCARLRKYGHEAISDRWALNGGYASHCHLVAGTGIVPVPEYLPDAVLAPANCATATVVNALRGTGVRSARVVVVQGCGMLGLTAIAYLRHLGVPAVIAGETDPARRALAARFGATAAVAPDGAAEAVSEASGGEGADIVVELSGSNAAVTASLGLLGIGGTLVLAGSVFPVDPVPVRPDDLVRRLITVTSTHNYTVRDLVDAVAFLSALDDLEPFAALVGASFPLERIDDAVKHALDERPPRTALIPG